jgi:hypothetical protein
MVLLAALIGAAVAFPGTASALDGNDAAHYESVILTNTTPSDAAQKLGQKIAEFQAQGDHDHAEYLAGVLDLICEQEASADC